MKICLIGNSHIACIREAWHEHNNGFEITFFGSHAKTTFDIKNENNFIVPTSDVVKENFSMTSEGSGSIDLSYFDLIVIHGLFVRPSGFKNYNENKKIKKPFFSYQVIESTNPFNESPCLHIISEIRKTSNIPIIASHIPYPAKQDIDGHISEEQNTIYLNIISQTLKDFNAELLFQHPDTMANYKSTKEHFTKGSQRLEPGKIVSTKKHGKDDLNHMNKEFGLFYLDNLKRYINFKQKGN